MEIGITRWHEYSVTMDFNVTKDLKKYIFITNEWHNQSVTQAVQFFTSKCYTNETQNE